MSDPTRADDERMSAEIDAHDEALKVAIEGGYCPRCRGRYKVELIEKAAAGEPLRRTLKFYCPATVPYFGTFPARNRACGWWVMYPIMVITGSVEMKEDEQ